MNTSFAKDGTPDIQADATKQEFNNASSGYQADLQQAGDVERPDDPTLKPTPPFQLPPDLQALDQAQQAELSLDRPDSLEPSPGMDSGPRF